MIQTELSFDPLFHDVKPEIVDRFVDHNREHPEVYRLFKKFALDLQQKGLRHFGAKAIMERIRWEVAVERAGDFKINNIFTSCYARLLIFEDKSFADFFEIRHTPGTLELH